MLQAALLPVLVSALARPGLAAPTDHLLAGRVLSHPALAHPALHVFSPQPRQSLFSLLPHNGAVVRQHSSVQPAAVAAPAVPAVQPAAVVIAKVEEEEAALPAHYDFGYSVSDAASGDSKSRQESRNGDVVTGSYSVADPDGRIRTVTYTADSEHGFQATVTYDGEAGPPAIPFNPPAAALPALPALQAVPAVQPAAVIAARDEEPVTTEAPEEVTEAPAPVTAAPVTAAPAPARAVPAQQAAAVLGPFRQLVPAYHSLPRTVSRVHSLPATVSHLAPFATHHNLVQAVPARQLVHSGLHGLHGLTAVRDLGNGLHQVHSVPHHQVQALHSLPNGLTAVRAVPQQLDLSQFTFLSNGQILG